MSGLKAGLLTFGGAYTVIPFLRDDAVGHGWMSDAHFLDGLALSGILPAPLIIFSTFVGYFGGGPPGALAMTVGIFLPAFCFTLFFHDQLERIVDHGALHSFLEGVSAGVVGLIAATTLELGLHDGPEHPCPARRARNLRGGACAPLRMEGENGSALHRSRRGAGGPRLVLVGRENRSAARTRPARLLNGAKPPRGNDSHYAPTSRPSRD